MAGSARLCVTNQKGGVGKTTVAINVAGALNDRGSNVLFVDLDPQGNATEGLGLIDAYDAEPPTLLDALLEPEECSLESLICTHPEMDVVPSNVDMNAAEMSLVREPGGETRLETLLSQVESQYDVVVVDCAPYLGLLTDNAMYATKNLVIPALAEPTSKRSLELLFDYVSALEMEHEIEIDAQALVANRIENTNEADRMLEWFEDALPDVPLYEVRKRVALQRAFSDGGSLFGTSKESDMKTVFREMAASLEDSLETHEVMV